MQKWNHDPPPSTYFTTFMIMLTTLVRIQTVQPFYPKFDRWLRRQPAASWVNDPAVMPAPLRKFYPDWSILHLFCGADSLVYGPCIRFLVERCHASVHAVSGDGLRPLDIAAIAGQLDTVRYLLSAGASPSGGLHAAASGPHLMMVRFFVEAMGMSVHEKREGGRPLEVAARNGHLETVKYLLSRGASPEGGLHAAVLGQQLLMIRYFVEHVGQSVHGTLNRSCDDLPALTPLELLASSAPATVAPEIIQYLVTRGARLDGILPTACLWGSDRVVECIVRERYVSNLDDVSWGRNPVALAAEVWDGLHIPRLRIIQTLLQQGMRVSPPSVPYILAHCAMAGRFTYALQVLDSVPESSRYIPETLSLLLRPTTGQDAWQKQWHCARWFVKNSCFVHPQFFSTLPKEHQDLLTRSLPQGEWSLHGSWTRGTTRWIPLPKAVPASASASELEESATPIRTSERMKKAVAMPPGFIHSQKTQRKRQREQQMEPDTPNVKRKISIQGAKNVK